MTTSARLELERLEVFLGSDRFSVWKVEMKNFLEMEWLRATDRKRYNGDHRRWMHEAKIEPIRTLEQKVRRAQENNLLRHQAEQTAGLIRSVLVKLPQRPDG